MQTFSEYNFGIFEIITLIILFGISFLATYFIVPLVMKFARSRGWIGIDIHKLEKPEVPESGGISIALGLVISLVISIFIFPTLINEILVILLTVIIASIIGIIDDRIKLSSLEKTALTIINGGPIFLLYYVGFIEYQSPTIPILGSLRLTLIYPLVTPVIIAVTSNTVNMLEGYNGEGSGTCLIAVIFMLISGIIWGSAQAVIYSVPFIAILLAFWLYNKHPAKIFPGDIGTLTVGSMIGCIAIFGSIEVPTFCVLLGHVFNSFYVISSLRKLMESSEIQLEKSDIELLENGKIKASREDDAAMSLPRLILAKGELTESELVKNFYALSLVCGQFAIVSAVTMAWFVMSEDILLIVSSGIIVGIISGGIILLTYLKFPKIRGIVVIMVVLLTCGVVFLWFIDMVIMEYFPNPYNLVISAVFTTIGLGIWYYIGCLRYFWTQIDKMKKRENAEKK